MWHIIKIEAKLFVFQKSNIFYFFKGDLPILCQANIQSLNSPTTFSPVTILNLNSLNITMIDPCTFNNLTSLTSINLQYNNLTFLNTSVFSGLTSLQNLNLSHNELTVFYASFVEDLYNIVYLDLSSNRLFNIINDINIEYISISIPSTYIAEIHLEYNLLGTQSQNILTEIFSYFTNNANTFVVYMEGNPIYDNITDIESLCGSNSKCLIVPNDLTTTSTYSMTTSNMKSSCLNNCNLFINYIYTY